MPKIMPQTLLVPAPANRAQSAQRVSKFCLGVWASVLLLAYFLPAAARADAAPAPVIFVIDAALEPQDLTIATQVALATSSQLPDDTAFSIIVYDDVIQKVAPLGVMGTERLALIKHILDDARPMQTSNLAAAIERAQDELKDHSTGHIVLITTATITTQNTDSHAQFLAWYEDVLLPAIAEKNLQLTFVTQAQIDNNNLLKVAASYQNTHIIPLRPGDAASDNLVTLLSQPLGVLNDTANSPAETYPKPQEPDTVSNVKVEKRAVLPQGSSEYASRLTTLLQNRPLLQLLWYASLALLLLILCAWLVWSVRKRRALQSQAEQTGQSATGSAYLPLNEQPSRHVDSVAEAIDNFESNANATPTPKSIKSLDAKKIAKDSTGKNTTNADNNDEVTRQRAPNTKPPKRS